MCWYHSMFCGLTEIIDGLGRILSFGKIHLNLSFKYTVWQSKRNCFNKIKLG